MIKTKDILNEIEELEDELIRISNEVQELRTRVPEGASLRAVKHGSGYQYFVRQRGSHGNGTYIRKGEREIASHLAQIEYDLKLQSELEDILKMLKELNVVWTENPYETVCEKVIPGKRALVSVPYASDESFLSDWLCQEYQKMPFRDGYPEFYTRKGIRVRSKSEVIIADILDDLSIPFLYEKPIFLGREIIHPDFTLLKISERKEVYWEHFGMMDDMEYRNNAFFKIRRYEENGFFPFDSLVCTFESGNNPLNTRAIRKMALRLRDLLS